MQNEACVTSTSAGWFCLGLRPFSRGKNQNVLEIIDPGNIELWKCKDLEIKDDGVENPGNIKLWNYGSENIWFSNTVQDSGNI